MSTIYIMWLRELKRYWRSKSRIVGSLGQPLLFLLALGYGMGSVFQRAGEGNYINFLAPGIVGMSIIFTAVFSGVQVIWDRQFGFLKETMVAPVSRFNIMIGRTLGGATIATLQGVVVFLLALIPGFRPYNWALMLPAVLVMFLVAVLFTALGTAIASVLSDMQGFQLIMNFLVMPLFFLSGALFPLSGLPAALSLVTKFDPLSYGIDALRELLLNQGVFGLGLDTSVLAVVTLIFLAAGSYLFSKIQI
ncbi:MAG: ABC transporter permease [Patescibacteria group bacterium]|nr:ABC transporter permease [Patescibacteria group bacterium]